MGKSVLLLLLGAPCILSSGLYEGCKEFSLTDSRGMTATYDLSEFNLNLDVFQVTDTNNPDYHYDFNICGQIDEEIFTDSAIIPEHCAHPQTQHGPCIETYEPTDIGIPQCKTYEATTGRVPSALQVVTDSRNNATTCYWLGMAVQSADHIPEYTKALLDPDDAGKGVVFTILNGEWCDVVGRNRELRVKLECPDDPRIEFEPGAHYNDVQSEAVEEVDTCIYELAVATPLACPTRCVSRVNLEMYAVCATHGICAADPYGAGTENYPNGTLRCLCDAGYNGTICEETVSELTYVDRSHPGLLAAIVICIVLLGVAIVCAAVLCHKIRMREMDAARGTEHLAGGMLHDEDDRQLEQQKADAMTMNIGVDEPPNDVMGTGAVQLQTIDDQLEEHNRAENQRNELLDDETAPDVVEQETDE